MKDLRGVWCLCVWKVICKERSKLEEQQPFQSKGSFKWTLLVKKKILFCYSIYGHSRTSTAVLCFQRIIVYMHTHFKPMREPATKILTPRAATQEKVSLLNKLSVARKQPAALHRHLLFWLWPLWPLLSFQLSYQN